MTETRTRPRRIARGIGCLALILSPCLLGVCGVPRLSCSAPSVTDEPPVMREVRRMESSVRSTRYSHPTHVDVARGRYEFDCSGMVNWVLARSSPLAWRSISARARRPRARDYARLLHGLSHGRPARGWQPVPRVADARAGDVVAWEAREPFALGNTGHMGIIVAPPEPYAWPRGAYRVRIADSTSFAHSDDTRLAGMGDGLGRGTILLVADRETDAPREMGWWGDLPFVSLDVPVAIGRPVR